MFAEQDVEQLLREHGALLQAHAQVQARCTMMAREQAMRIRHLDAELMRSRAARIMGVTQLAWERDDRAAFEQSVPGLKRRAELGRQVEAMQSRIQELMRRLHRRALSDDAGPAAPAVPVDAILPEDLEASLQAADLVICQTGCLSHGDYWRVQDHCKRSGKVCMMVDQPDGLQIVRIHGATMQR